MDTEFEDVVAHFPQLQFEDPAAQRAAFEAMRTTAPPPRLPEDVKIHDTCSIPLADGHRVPVRIHVPRDLAHDAPTLVWIHGGGYVVGTADEDDALCARIASDVGIGVVSVEYRLAPEYPFPHGLDDCHAVAAALTDANRDASFAVLGTGRVVIGGGSAGAGLAAAVALRLRDEGRRALAGQILLYPFIDSTLKSPSMSSLAESAIFNAHDAEVCWQHYLGEQRFKPPAYGSPTAATDLNGLPPAYVVAAGADCLHDEAVDYALRTRAAGVSVELHSIADVPHGFTGVAPWTSASRRAIAGVIDAIRRFSGGQEISPPKPALAAASEK
ncbi:alpha/beta hydrolase [Rhodococcus sp. NPDC019627]|uniref:alpha/beta hydrolase n=1 Tax=unclassified Rhodococcus (in: high G+C Gram-positive bacteria) TaxID=192944 RepID=UPI0033D6A120